MTRYDTINRMRERSNTRGPARFLLGVPFSTHERVNSKEMRERERKLCGNFATSNLES